ncbi:hypothetical protein AAFF_G00236490 [Aldrovandia affinis]|uniref:Uncharacterized protein n=1 Tax=Aldrovandia affinis TaxID=143900 RepID=A0AAD7REK2_9TELE|nr:hypothetical protein AAFF_G00236490 [Aldrovandia affinis]
MATLPDTHPSVHEAFMEGKFVVQRGDKKFSLMALDQSQEHNIKFLKEDSGSKGSMRDRSHTRDYYRSAAGRKCSPTAQRT